MRRPVAYLLSDVTGVVPGFDVRRVAYLPDVPAGTWVAFGTAPDSRWPHRVVVVAGGVIMQRHLDAARDVVSGEMNALAALAHGGAALALVSGPMLAFLMGRKEATFGPPWLLPAGAARFRRLLEMVP